MSMEKGQLSIHTENFLPIIKKWLYSDRDIFIRELISNCCDAVAKRRMVGQIPDDYQPRVTVRVDKEHRILSFTDNGVGMTAEEVRKYINQVAFSGANDFMEKYKDSGEQIIGHFGLGFYSAFMVADKVRIDTLSCLPDAKAVCWESDGSVEYTMEETEREEVGTTVTLYLNNESDEFLDGNTVKSTIRKYCSFMPTPIYCEVAEDEKKHEHDHEDGCECGHDHEHEENCECGHDHEHDHEEEVPEMLNTPNPLYMRVPKDCTDEDYKKFYRDTFHEWDEPLFWIHLNADYPFNLHGILYFPRLKNEITNEGQVKLYSNQVFIADNIKEIIPEFLLLLKGVVDCPDLPLNVSRSFLQNDGYVRKLSDYITRKVADRLTGMFKNEREQYESYWKDIHPFIKYGCMRDNKFYDRMKDAIVYKTSKGEYETLAEYLDKAKDTHENKVFYAEDENRQANTVGLYEERGIEVVVMGTPIDIGFMQLIESKNENVHFTRVDADIADALRDSDAAIDADLTKKLEEMFKWAVDDINLKIRIEPLKNEETPAVLLLDENMRRYQEAMRLWGSDGMPQFPLERTLVLNSQHPLVQNLANRPQDDTAKDICLQLTDLAEMAQQSLPAERMNAFISRSLRLMTELATEEKPENKDELPVEETPATEPELPVEEKPESEELPVEEKPEEDK